MSDDPQAPVANAGEMQFDRADFVETASEETACGVCGEPLRGHYFDVNGKMACERCRYDVEAALSQQGGAGGFFKAAFAGLGVAAVGSAIYYGVREATGYEFGLISILIGYGVGMTVRWGSRAKGGWVYQSLAIFLTYMAIVSTYLPMVFKEIGKNVEKDKAAATAPAQPGGADPAVVKASTVAPAPAPEVEISLGDAALGIGALFLLIMALPFLAGFENIIGLAIIAFGLYEAWKINRRTVLSITGPFQIGASPAAPATGP
jgi:hypothetical protein